MKHLLIAAAALSLASTPAIAAPCRGAHGKFIKCGATTAQPKPVRCKDARGKFAKCGSPGAKPA